MITKQMAMDAKIGDYLYAKQEWDGKIITVRVSGECETVKIRPEQFCLPVQCGLATYGAITHINALWWFTNPELA